VFYYKIIGKSMGKRELLIVIVFAAVGVLAYQLTAPAPKAGERGFSLTDLWTHVRREVRGNAATASFAHRGALPVPPELTQVRIVNAHGVMVQGESRRDIAYELTVQSRAEDEALALDTAKRTALKHDDLGTAIELRVAFPPEGRQTGMLVLKVPARLSVRIESSGPAAGAEVTGVRSVHLAGISGGTTIANAPGGVSGGHQRGELTVSNVGTVNLTLTNSRARFTGVSNGLTLTVRNSSECRITDSAGPVAVEATNAELTVTGHSGPIRVSGNGGRITLNRPSEEARVDTRNAEVEVALASAVPLTLITTRETLRLLLDGPPAVTIDALTIDGGAIQAADFNLSPEAGDREVRLLHHFGSGKAPRLSLRNRGADIVIRKGK
jgi:hypothetical protein